MELRTLISECLVAAAPQRRHQATLRTETEGDGDHSERQCPVRAARGTAVVDFAPLHHSYLE